MGLSLQQKLKQVFPESTGSSISWKFPKFHAMQHIPRLLVMFGCCENVSTQSGKMAHKAHIKEAMFSTNCKDWEIQIMSAHACMGAMVEEMEEVSDALQDWLDMHRGRSDPERVVANCLGASRGIKFELEKSWEKQEALCRHLRLSAGGIKGRSQEIDLLCLGDDKYVYRNSHQALRHLQRCLFNFIVQYYDDYLQPELAACIKRKKQNKYPVPLEELNKVLNNKYQGRQDHCLESANTGDIEGIQRMRCYPFEKTSVCTLPFTGCKFHCKNQKDIVALIPSDVAPDDFRYNRDPGTIDMARIQLFFEFTIVPHKLEDDEILDADFPTEEDT
eukprot:3420814-Rhodomonas_salina.1